MIYGPPDISLSGPIYQLPRNRRAWVGQPFRRACRFACGTAVLSALTLVVYAGSGLAEATVGPGRVSAQSFLIVRGDGPTGFELGPYVVSAAHDKPRDPALSLAAEIKALGRPSSCRPEDSPPTLEIGFVEWKQLHLRSQQSPGNLVPYQDPCSVDPRRMWVSSFEIEGRSRWHTNRGLRVGSSASVFHKLYPEARHAVAQSWGVGEVPLPSFHVNARDNAALRVGLVAGAVTELEVVIDGSER